MAVGKFSASATRCAGNLPISATAQWSRGARQISTEVSVGDPTEQNLDCADAKQADLIAMGNHGHGRLAGLYSEASHKKSSPGPQYAVLCLSPTSFEKSEISGASIGLSGSLTEFSMP